MVSVINGGIISFGSKIAEYDKFLLQLAPFKSIFLFNIIYLNKTNIK